MSVKGVKQGKEKLWLAERALGESVCELDEKLDKLFETHGIITACQVHLKLR